MYSVDFDNGITIDFDKEPTPEQISEAYSQYQKGTETKKPTFGRPLQAIKNFSTGVADIAKNVFGRAQEITKDVAGTQTGTELPFTSARGARDVVSATGAGVAGIAGEAVKTIYNFVTPESGKQGGAQIVQDIVNSKTGQAISNTIYDFARNNPTIANEISKTLDIANLALPTSRTITQPATSLARTGLETASQVASKTATGFTQGIANVSNNVAERAINSLIVPNKNLFAYGKNPGRVLAKRGVVANSMEELGTKVASELESTGQAIAQVGSDIAQGGLLTLRQPFKSLDEAIKTAASQNNQTLLNRLKDVKKALGENLVPTIDELGDTVITSAGKRKLEDITFDEVRNLMRFVGKQTKYTGNLSDDTIVNKALQETYSNIKKQSLDFADNVNPSKAKQFRQLTEDYGDLISADAAITNREALLARQALVGFSPTISGLGAGMITAIATGGASIPAVLTGLSAAAIQKLAASTPFKTRLAALLSTRTPQEISILVKKVPAISKILGVGAGFVPAAATRPISERLKNPLLNN